jgi:hypothetical protein
MAEDVKNARERVGRGAYEGPGGPAFDGTGQKKVVTLKRVVARLALRFFT